GGGGLLVAAGVGVLLLDVDGLVEHTIDTGADPSQIRVNDGIVDADGRFWFGLMPYDGSPGQGSLWRLDPDLLLHRVVEQITVPNGPALSQDGTVLYLADSAAGVIFCHSVDRATGDLGPGHPFAHVSDASPDGLAVDSDGGVWCALWGSGRLHRYSPEGVPECVIALPVQQPTSVALSPHGGAALVTSAAHGLAQAGYLDGRSLWVEVGATGLTARPFG
ncbi:MAG: SMP-30/gluconolactonase/LRE family protein, partial [Ornithinimicrobium sp.]